LCARIPGALASPPHRTPSGAPRHPTLPQRRLWPSPLSVPPRCETTPRPACLWHPPLPPGPAAYNAAVASAPPRPTAPGAALPAHLDGPGAAPPLPPLASTPRVPRPVAGRGNGPPAAGPRRALRGDGPAWLHRGPASVGPATPGPPAPPGPCARWWPLHGPHGLVALARPLLCACHSARPPLPCALHRSQAARRTAGAPRAPGVASPLAWPQAGPAPRLLRLPLPRALRLQRGPRQPPPRGPHGPSRHLHLPASGPGPPPPAPARRHGVSPPLPPARLARRLGASPALRLAPCQLCRPARDAPPQEGAGTPPRGPAAPTPAPARGPLSDRWRPEARRHAGVDLSPGLCRSQLSGMHAADDCETTGWGTRTAPVRPQGSLRLAKAAQTRSATAFQRLADASCGSAHAPMVRSHTSVRPLPLPLS
jgi:hypothetical protein